MTIQKDKTLLPTQKLINQYLFFEKYTPDLIEPVLTAEWEEGLGKIAEGKMTKQEFMSGIEDYTTRFVATVKKNIAETQRKLCKCPVCAHGQMAEDTFNWKCTDCGFSLPRKLLENQLPDSAIIELCTEGKTKAAYPFTGKAGKPFKAFVLLGDKEDGSGKELRFEFPPRTATYHLPCPVCNGELQEGEMLIVCPACDLKFWKSFNGIKLTASDMENILKGKHTRLINGFVSKAKGTKFSARLVFDKTNKHVTFVFEKKPAPKKGNN